MKAKITLYAAFILLFTVCMTTTRAQTIPQPWLDYPDFGVGINNNPINIFWHLNAAMPAGGTYHLQVSLNPNYSSFVVDSSNITVGEYDNFSMSASTTYYFRVRVETSSDTGSWSTGWFSSSSSLNGGGGGGGGSTAASVTIGGVTTTGSAFTVPVKLDLNGNTGSKAYSGTITYKPSNFTYTGFSDLPGTIVNDNSMSLSVSNNTTTGTIVFLAIGSNTISTGIRDTLFNLSFNITGSSSNSPDSIVASGFQGFLSTFTNFSYTSGIINWSTASTPTALKGDANGDGVVDLNDAILVAQEISAVGGVSDPVGTPATGAIITNSTLRDNADANSDGYISLSDITSILNIIQGLSPKIVLSTPGTGVLVVSSAKYQTENQQVSLPISLTNAKNVLNADIIFKYDPLKIQYQSFATQLLSSGYFVNAKEMAPGKAQFQFASQSALEGVVNAGTIILKFAGQDPPIGTVIKTEYRINSNSYQQGPDIVFGVTGIETNGSALAAQMPTKFSVSQNYPNPFNPTTEIQYALPHASNVSIKIYNMLGQEIKTLVSGEKSAGNYTVQWNGDNNFGAKVSSGAYIYRVIAGNNVVTKKMILLK